MNPFLLTYVLSHTAHPASFVSPGVSQMEIYPLLPLSLCRSPAYTSFLDIGQSALVRPITAMYLHMVQIFYNR